MDSPACFVARLREVKLEHMVESFRAARMDTFAKMAFGSTYVPNVSPPDVFIREIVVPITGREDPGIDVMVGLRRLFLDAYGLSVADIKERVEGGGFRIRIVATDLGPDSPLGPGPKDGQFNDWDPEVFQARVGPKNYHWPSGMPGGSG